MARFFNAFMNEYLSDLILLVILITYLKNGYVYCSLFYLCAF